MNIKNEAPSGDYYDSWCRVKCPDKSCNVLNWIELGDLTDYTVNDTHAAMCWKCNTKFWIDWKIKYYSDDHFDYTDMDESKDLIDQEEIDCVKGRETAP